MSKYHCGMTVRKRVNHSAQYISAGEVAPGDLRARVVEDIEAGAFRREAAE